MQLDIISLDIVTLLLFIPIIVTIINIARYLIGFKTLGFYPTIALSFAFILTGGKIGAIITLIVLLTSYPVYRVLAKVRLHYVSKISINYTILSIVLLTFIYLSMRIEPIAQFVNFNNTDLGGMLLIIVASDSVVKQLTRKDLLTNIRSAAETVIIALLGWGFLKIPDITQIILQNAWIIPLLIIANLLIGQTTILKLLELNKFRFIIKDKEPKE